MRKGRSILGQLGRDMVSAVIDSLTLTTAEPSLSPIYLLWVFESRISEVDVCGILSPVERNEDMLESG